ncbi:MAG: enoyl-CoA hydratase/isomerase family protein [Actinomycetota bacterium]
MTRPAVQTFATIEVALDDRVGRLTLHQPDRLNPLGNDTMTELIAAAQWFDTTSASVVVVSGAGRAFSAGFDLGQFTGGEPVIDVDLRTADELGWRMAEAVERMRAVTVAAISGPCIGGGVVLASACDLRIAAEDAVFAVPEVDLGIPLTWGGIPRLVRDIGPTMTRELVLTCRRFEPAEALRIGFLNRVVEPDSLDSVVEELVSSLALKAPSVVAATKRQVHDTMERMAPTSDAWAGADLLTAARRDPEALAAAQAYLERRNTR